MLRSIVLSRSTRTRRSFLGKDCTQTNKAKGGFSIDLPERRIPVILQSLPLRTSFNRTDHEGAIRMLVFRDYYTSGCYGSFL